MIRILFLLVLILFLTALGHDLYIYSLNMDRAFQPADIGAIWARYHLESFQDFASYIDLQSQPLLRMFFAVPALIFTGVILAVLFLMMGFKALMENRHAMSVKNSSADALGRRKRKVEYKKK